MTNSIINIQNLSKSFYVGKQDVPVLKNLSFVIKQGDFCIIFGPSGCGKSTLLHTILGLEKPSSGTCTVLNNNLYEFQQTEDERSDFRKNAEEMKTQRFTNAVSNLETIQAKVAAKITELSATGINTTDAQTFLDSSVKNLTDAKAKIAEIVVPADGSTITADQFATIKLTARDARNLLEQARQDLISSIKSLRIATGSTEGTSTENNASTTQQ